MAADPTPTLGPGPSVRLDPASRPPLIALDREASFDQIRTDLRVSMEPDRQVWDGVEAHLDLGLREPDLFHLRRLVHLLKDDFGVNVVGMRCDPTALRRFAERELKVRLHLTEPEPPPSPAPDPDPPQEPTDSLDLTSEPEVPEPTGSREGQDTVRVEHRTLRSGAILRHGGDIVLYGDVNPGAEVLAGGSITILGTLMGVAHAGTRTGDRAWILALDLKATQLRIGQRISIPGEPANGSSGNGSGRTPRAPEFASVQGGVIVIEPWRGRLPREETRRSDA